MYVRREAHGVCRKHPVTGEHFHEPRIVLSGDHEDAEKLFTVLAGYGEFIQDKLDVAVLDEDEYTGEDIERMRALKEFAGTLFEQVAPVYGEMVAARS